MTILALDLFSQGARKFADFLWPPTCLGCHGQTPTPHTLCSTCWQDITFLTDPLCTTCGTPLPYEEEKDEDDITPPLCAQCLAKPPKFTKARSLMAYKGQAANLIIQFKRNPAAATFPFLAKQAIYALSQFIPADEIDQLLLIPVPLHWRRLVMRGFNQSAKLAAAIHQHHPQTIYAPNLLHKNRSTPSQGQFDRQQRFRNVKGAFSVKNQLDSHTKQPVLLIDDVWTTGATLDACLTTLKRAKFEKIYVLTLARVL